MTISDIQQICRRLKGVTEDIKWEDHLCFNVGGKMFLITSPDRVPPSASFKVRDEEFDMISSRPGLEPAAYLARHKWVAVDDIGRLGKKDWEKYIATSYELVAAKLPAKTRRELGIA